MTRADGLYIAEMPYPAHLDDAAVDAQIVEMIELAPRQGSYELAFQYGCGNPARSWAQHMRVYRSEMRAECAEAAWAVLAATWQNTTDDDGPSPESQDDTVHACPECERPNQFGELCAECTQERDRYESTREMEAL